MIELDIYIYCYDSNYIDRFKSITLKNYKCNLHYISCYHSSPINGLITENVFFSIFKNKYSCKMVSQDIPNSNPILSFIIKPDKQKYDKTLESFVTMNFHNPDYLKSILNDEYYNIFDHAKISWGTITKTFQTKLKTELTDIFHIKENYEKLINNHIPFPHVILDVDEINDYITSFDNTKYDNLVTTYNKVYNTMGNNVSSVAGSTCNNIKYMCHASIGMGDFIQRFERLYKLLNFPDNKFVPIKNKIYSYNNPNHGRSKYMTMYDFPGFNFIETHDDIIDNLIVNIHFQNLFEIIMFNKNYFERFDTNKYILINLGSYIINIKNRPIINSMFNWKNDQKIIKEISIPYTIPEWKLNGDITNKLLIMHFRRGDYINQLLSNQSNPRTMSTFKHLMKNINNINEDNIDIIIISDHYDLTKIPNDKQKYIPILFDYDNINIGDKIIIKNTTYTIRDKVIGTTEECNINTLKYIAKCDYHIGNMSCFPVIMGKIFNKNKINHIRYTESNIRNMLDLDKLYKIMVNNTN